MMVVSFYEIQVSFIGFRRHTDRSGETCFDAYGIDGIVVYIIMKKLESMNKLSVYRNFVP